LRPIIVGIGGGHSGAGKTKTACEVLKRSKGWGAIKFTKTSFYSSITDDQENLSDKGKDTALFLEAGAGKVLWVQSSGDELPETASLAIQMLEDYPVIVIEGNSMIEAVAPDIVVFVAGDKKRFKPGAERVLSMADIVITDEDRLPGIPQGAELFRPDDIERCAHFVLGHIKKSYR
jgi:molybdopterin-guanine dinucleotide biosynthesis protein